MPLTNEERNYLKLLGGNIVKKRKERGIKQKELLHNYYSCFCEPNGFQLEI